jgi:hypothetical protein
MHTSINLYEQCYHLCENNVVSMLNACSPAGVFFVRESTLMHLVDDECSSLISSAKLCGTFDTDANIVEDVKQVTLSMYLLIQSALHLRQSPATFIKTLRNVITVYMRHSSDLIINRALMTFVYRKVIKHLRLEIGHHVVLGKTF